MSNTHAVIKRISFLMVFAEFFDWF